MDYLWSPWRYQYVTKAGSAEGCIFCIQPAEQRDSETYIVYRGRANYVILNRYPYTSGHLMVVPYEHLPDLEGAPEATVVELMLLTRRAVEHLKAIYHPLGLNVGMNLGECAGAGVAGHLHMHVLPRWPGDVSFMTSVGETRVLPEDLDVTYRKLHTAFQGDRQSR